MQRHRLLDRLDASSAASLTLLLGYAGSGKSVLLSSWLATRPAMRVAWLSCDDGDTDPLRFWTALVASVRLSEPSFGDDTLDRIELDGRVDLPAICVLSDELRAITQPLVIIVDDIHDAAALLAALGAGSTAKPSRSWPAGPRGGQPGYSSRVCRFEIGTTHRPTSSRLRQRTRAELANFCSGHPTRFVVRVEEPMIHAVVFLAPVLRPRTRQRA